MKTLFELMNDEITKLKIQGLTDYEKLDDFISDEKRSGDFVEGLSKGVDFDMPDVDNPLYYIADSRAQHSALTFLMGLIFKNSFSLFDEIGNEFSDQGASFGIWLLTSLNHDIGYFRLKEINDSTLSFRTKYKYYLLEDCYSSQAEIAVLNDFNNHYPSILAYSYEEIEAYDTYARNYHIKQNDDEKIDHGILGGMYLFDNKIKYCLRNKLGKDDFLYTKAAALTIAQHNIYKSSTVESDGEYGEQLKKLHSTSDFVIGKDKPALLLLSLVDTVECIKRLSRKKNPKGYLESLTVLKNIEAEIRNNDITLDFRRLYSVIENRKNGKSELKDVLDNHLRAILGMPSWTEFSVSESENAVLRIRLS